LNRPRRRARASKPIQIEEGKWYVLENPETTICCDCCLAHVTEYKLDKNMRLIFRTRRDDKRTAELRAEAHVIVTRDITVE
jgi:hypothetical protein